MHEQPSCLVSFVVPLFRTGSQVRGLLAAFQDLPLAGSYELILVNDGSDDDTLALAQEAVASAEFPVTLVDMAKNFGEHAAVLEGYRHSSGEFVINLDDDLQNPVSEALKVLERLQQSDAEVVYTYYDQKMHSMFRNFGSWLTNLAATHLLGKPRDLYLSSFRGLRRELVARIASYQGPYPYIDGLILAATSRIDKILVRHDARQSGESSYTLRKLLRLWMNMFFNFSVMPLRLASILGLLLCGSGLLILLVVLIETLFFAGMRQAGWASLMAAIAIFSGSQLLILGVMGEYIGRTYLTLAGKPQAIVRSVIVHRPAP